MSPVSKTGKQPFFAIDNIDFMECTPDGQNTLHGTIIVVNQDNKAAGIPVGKQLVIPKRAKNVSLPIANTDAPRLLSPKKIVTFSKYVFGSDKEIIAEYQSLDKMWFFACFLHKHLQSPLLSESYPKYPEENASNDPPTCNRPKSMPIWAATNLRIIAASDQTTPSKSMTRIASPLFRYPPTNLETHYKALCLVQDISAVVTGSNRKTIITLNMKLYEKAVKLQQANGIHNWFSRIGELHTCFASLHALGKFIAGSGLDAVSIEEDIYSPSNLRQILGCRSYK